MAMATTLQEYLQHRHAAYEVMSHPPTARSLETAVRAHVPAESLAKSVILGDNMGGYVMAVLPSNCQVAINKLSDQIGRNLHLASEREISTLFTDCETGAIPPLGPAYGLKTVLEEDLTRSPDVYFEAGDHEKLVHMRMDTFLDLMADTDRAHFGRHMM